MAEEERGDATAALKIFNDLGLPDSKGAKWVQAQFTEDFMQETELPSAGETRARGNAWLVRENGDKSVELIVGQTRLMRAKRISADADPEKPGGSGELKPVVIEAANLQDDLAAIRQGLEAVAKEVAAAGSDPSAESYQMGNHVAAAGQALLLLAHLERQGHADLVRPLLPLALLPGPARAKEIDAAIGSIALGRLEELNEQWVKNGEVAKYADGLEALAARFYRGWDAQEAARLLARRVRAPAPVNAGLETATAEAASLLLSLRPSNLPSLPLGRNWVLPQRPGSAEEAGEPRIFRGRMARSGGNATQGKLATFFQQRAAAAAALVPLLSDARVLRIMHGETYRTMMTSSFVNEDDDPATGTAAAERALETLPRPYQMGELVSELLSALLPNRFSFRDSSRGPAALHAEIADWVHQLAAMSDEEMAWAYLKGAEGSNEEGFQEGLSYLVEHGSPATLERLQQVFLDPAVWDRGAISSLAGTLKTYVDKLGPAAGEFGPKLLATVKKAGEERGREEEGEQAPNAGYRQQMAAQQAAELRQLEQILHPRAFPEMLAEFSAAKEEEMATLTPALVAALGEDREGAGAGQIYRAAVTAPPERRQMLLSLLLRPAAGPAANPAVFKDPATREAAKTLLQDSFSVSESGSDASSDFTVADCAAYAVLVSCLPPTEQQQWSELGQAAGPVAQRWGRAAALATVAGATRPPLPDAARVPKESVAKTLEAWERLGPAELLAAFCALPDEQQVAVSKALDRRAVWGKSLLDGQLTVVRVALDKDPAFPRQAWSGRRFDEKLRGEIVAVLEQQAREGRYHTVNVMAAYPLSGLTLHVLPNPRRLSPPELAGLKLEGLGNLSPPDAALGSLFSCYGRGRGGLGAAAQLLRPLWKDAAVSAGWEKAHGGDFPVAAPLADAGASAPAPETESNPGWVSRSPAAYCRLLGRLEKGEAPVIARFRFALYSAGVSADPAAEAAQALPEE